MKSLYDSIDSSLIKGINSLRSTGWGNSLCFLGAWLVFFLVGCEKQKVEKPNPEVELTSGSAITRIAVGSCAHQKKNQIIWEPIVAAQPDLFVFTGDNIYADTEDMEEMRAEYAMLAAKPGYQKLKATCPILAVWDDHDYGLNDAGKEYSKKIESEANFHEFFETPPGSEVFSYPGTYQVRYFGDTGQRLQVCTRWRSRRNRGSDISVRSAPYLDKTDAAALLLPPVSLPWRDNLLWWASLQLLG